MSSRSVEPGKSAATEPGKAQAPGNLRFKYILVPFDFSKPAEAALQYAITFAKQFDSELTLVYVIEPLAFSDFDATPLAMDNDAAVEHAKQRLTAIRLQQEEDGAYIKNIKVNVGKPFHEIATMARGLKQDLIIIATHGRTGLTQVLMGSTAERVVRHAPCPVLVVREKAK